MTMIIAATATRSGRGPSCPTFSTEGRRLMRHAVAGCRRSRMAGRRKQRWSIIASGVAASRLIARRRAKRGAWRYDDSGRAVRSAG
jgi:hypothetical protein